MTATQQPSSPRWPSLRRWDPYLQQCSAIRAAIVVLLSLRRGRGRQLWIGDSHSLTFLREGNWANFLVAPGGAVILRNGPRLMFSLARNGFPRHVQLLARVVGRWGRIDSFLPVFVAGEIDVRNALASRPDEDYAFVEAYVERARDLATTMRASRLVLVVPPPPCPRQRIDPSFPSVGTDDERAAVFQRLRAALHDAAAPWPSVTVIDGTDELSGPDGLMLAEMSDDGCHTNARGRAVIGARLRDALSHRGLR